MTIRSSSAHLHITITIPHGDQWYINQQHINQQQHPASSSSAGVPVPPPLVQQLVPAVDVESWPEVGKATAGGTAGSGGSSVGSTTGMWVGVVRRMVRGRVVQVGIGRVCGFFFFRIHFPFVLFCIAPFHS
jgi:hypothetical protein